MSVKHRELLGLSQFLEMMVTHNVIPGMQTLDKGFASALRK